jgi:hypothetical protein
MKLKGFNVVRIFNGLLMILFTLVAIVGRKLYTISSSSRNL